VTPTIAPVEGDGVLGLVGQMRPAILHLGDRGVGIVRMGPVVIRALLLRFPIDPRTMVRRRLVQPDAQNSRNANESAGAPGEAAVRIDPFEVANQQRSEIDSGLQTPPTHRLRMKASALGFDNVVRPVVPQRLIKASVEGTDSQPSASPSS
jgi:hypothetical protein